MGKKNRNTRFPIELELEHIKIKKVNRDKYGYYHIYVSCTAKKTKCRICGKKINKVHGHCKESIIEHLPILDQRVFIHVKWPRFICPDCDNNPTTSFNPSWLNSTGQLTTDYENYCLKSLINSTVKDTAMKLGTTEEMIEGIIDRKIDTSIDWNNLSITRIGIDEIALRKGHKQYLTIISDISVIHQVKVLGVLKGRTKDDIRPFLSSIPKELSHSLEGIAVDMSSSYIPALKETIDDDKIFNQIVTIDRFHVAKLINGKVDKERIKVVKSLKEKFENDEKKLDQIKHTMWPFRHHKKDLDEDEEQKLDSLFELAPILKKCYEIREELWEIFEKDISKEEADEEISKWIKIAENYKLKNNPFTSFIETYKEYKSNILNYFSYRCSSGSVEGLNNKIKVIKRRGYGFRNIGNFAKRIFLDINLKPILLPTI